MKNLINTIALFSLLGILTIGGTNSLAAGNCNNQESQVKVHYATTQSDSDYNITKVVSFCPQKTIVNSSLKKSIFALTKLTQGVIPLGVNSPVRITHNSYNQSNCKWANTYGINTLQDFYIQSYTTSKVVVKFCKFVNSAGIGSDARIITVIKKSILENISTSNVVILDQNGNCFGDQSGENFCLK